MKILTVYELHILIFVSPKVDYVRITSLFCVPKEVHIGVVLPALTNPGGGCFAA